MTVADRALAAPSVDHHDELERARIREGILYCLKVFVGVRLGLALLALLGLGLLPHTIDLGPNSVAGWPAHPITTGWHNLFTAWERFDGLWFLRIATGGYVDGDGSAAFFPLYPLLIRAASPILGGHPYAASLLVSNACFAGSLIVLYFLTASEFSESFARRAVLYLALFPTAFFFLAPYSESPFLLATLASFWGARRGKWWVAGVCGAAASATRNLGILLVPALALEALQQWRRPEAERDRTPLWPKLLWSAASGLGMLAYLLYWKVRNGDLLAPLHQQVNWQREGATPWHTIAKATDEAFSFLGTYPGGYFLMDWLIVMPCIALAVYAFFRFRSGFGFYAVASLLLPLSFIFPDRPFLSVPRFLAVVFPIHWAMAKLTEERPVAHHLVAGISAAGLGVLTVLFVNWYYVF